MSAAIGDRDYVYSRCAHCDTDNEPLHVNGAPGTGEQNWATYVCGGTGPGSGSAGCGANWSVTTQRGLEHNTDMGLQTLGRVPSDVASARYVSAPSDRYRANYASIFGHE